MTFCHITFHTARLLGIADFQFFKTLFQRCRWPRGLRCGFAAARFLGLWVRFPPGSVDVCCECCVLSGRGLCVGPITRPEESYWLWCVWVWSGATVTIYSYSEQVEEVGLRKEERKKNLLLVWTSKLPTKFCYRYRFCTTWIDFTSSCLFGWYRFEYYTPNSHCNSRFFQPKVCVCNFTSVCLFMKKSLLLLSRPSVRPHVSSRLLLDVFSWSLLLRTFMKICRVKTWFG